MRAAERILTRLADDGPSKVHDLARALSRSASATRQALARLEKKGKVERDQDLRWRLADGVVQDKRPEVAGVAGTDEETGDWRALTEEELAAQRVFVPAENLPDLRKRIEKLAKRAAKLNLPTITLEVGEAVLVKGKKRQSAYGPRRTPTRVFYEVKVHGPPVQIAGWEFVARIEHAGAGNLLHTVPTAELEPNELKAFRGRGDWCEHCDTARRRKDTFILRATPECRQRVPGTLMQVGRNCLRDFLGHENPTSIARLAQYVQEALDGCVDDPEGYGGSWTPSHFALVDFLAACQGFVEQDGWCSRTKALQVYGDKGAATANNAWDLLVATAADAKPPRRLTRNDKADWHAYEAVARRALERGLELLQEAEQDDRLSDYEHNLLVCLRSESVTYKSAGYVGSLLGYVKRADEKAAAKKGFSELAAESKFFGTVKGRLRDLEVTVLRSVSTENYYGAVEIISFVTTEGNLGVCFFGGNVRWLEIGRTYKLDMTVKAHKVNTRTEIAFKETQVQRLVCKARKRADGGWDRWTGSDWEAA